MGKTSRTSSLFRLTKDLEICLDRIERDGKVDKEVRDKTMKIFKLLKIEVGRLDKDVIALSGCAKKVLDRYGWNEVASRTLPCRSTDPQCGFSE
jgi:hypothetical protein